VATVASLIALKAVAIPRRSASNNPQKVGSDIHDLVRLVQGCDFGTGAGAINAGGDDPQHQPTRPNTRKPVAVGLGFCSGQRSR